MPELTPTQTNLLNQLRGETDPENPQSFIELNSEENRTARALERKGLVELEEWGTLLAAQIKVVAPEKGPEERIKELEAALAPFEDAAVTMEHLAGANFECTVPPVEAFRKAQEVLKS